MPVTYTSTIEAQLVAGTWTNLSTDVLGDVTCEYGIDGNGPIDVMASSGTMRFALNNSAQNSGSQLGWYSPAHTSKRTGWTFGIPVRWILSHNSTASVTSITRVSSTATVTTGAAHGLASNDWVTIAGAVETEYNGTFQVTVTGGSTFTYTVSGTPATPATGTITWVQVYVRFRGKVSDIDVMPGQYQDRRVNVVCYDAIKDMMDAGMREVTTQVAQTEAQLITTLLAALPTDAQPPAQSIETGLDTYPYAFDNVGDGMRAGALIRDIVLSSRGVFFAKGDGTAKYVTRQSRAVAGSVATFTNATLVDVVAPSTLDVIFNRVRVTIHPKTVDTAATTVLWAQTGTAPLLTPGSSMTIWGSYYDANQEKRLIGGTAQVTPIVSTTDYLGNAAADGSGADRTANLTITTTAFASTVKFLVENTGATDTYVTKLQIRGKGIYDDGPRTFESFSTQTYGDRPLDLDMPYQDDPGVGRDAATYIRAQFDNLSNQVNELEFVASKTSALFSQAMLREPSDVVTVSETVTGLASIDAIIQSVSLTMHHKTQLKCRLRLTRGDPFNVWILGTAGLKDEGSSTATQPKEQRKVQAK